MTTNETEVQIFIFKCIAVPHFQWLKYKWTNRHNTVLSFINTKFWKKLKHLVFLVY